MELHTIGIDLGKTVFHLVGLQVADRPDRTRAVSAVGIVLPKPIHAGCRIPGNYAHPMRWN
jgi:hypothetical protein